MTTRDELKKKAASLRKTLAEIDRITGGGNNQRDSQQAYKLKVSRAQAEAGPTLPPEDAVRKKECGESLKLFCETYRPAAFSLEWSPDHIKILDKIEHTVRDGGLFALAMPRGSGKTTITVTAAIWALLYGYRRWVCLIGATAPKASGLLKGIKMELRFNDLLHRDFKEVTQYIRHLEGQSKRATLQTCDTKPTNISWLADSLTMPTATLHTGEPSPASGATVSVCGITGDIRGQLASLPDGRVIRPDYVLLDDPQTRESAKSQQQTEDRIATLMGDVLGLAGPGVKISGVMPCTVISRGDMADQILDRDNHPEWSGERTKLLRSFPTNIALWEEYREIRDADLRNDGNGSAATEFYLDRLAEMDAGADPSWLARYNPDEISAVQNCMNLYFRDEAAFAAEYQNEPLEQIDDTTLSADEICERQHHLTKGILPAKANTVTAFIDVQKDLLFYVVAGWSDTFRGWVVDYGSFPDQKTPNFRLQSARHTLSKVFPRLSMEGTIRKGLEALVAQLCGKPWRREDGADLSIGRLLIDANWGQSRDVVYGFCRETSHRSLVLPSHGKFIGASSDPLNHKYAGSRAGKVIGTHWRIDKAKDNPSRYVLYDTNYWKSFAHQRLATDPAEPAALTLFQASPRSHKTFASHLKAEYPVRVEGKGRTVDEWKIRPERPDNHWFDCLVGCCVAANIAGVTMRESAAKKVGGSGKRMSLGQMAASSRGR